MGRRVRGRRRHRAGSVRVDAFDDIGRNGLRLSIKAKDVIHAAGRAAAKHVKKRLRQGVDMEGKSLPGPNRMKDTGQLNRSIKYVPGKRLVMATGSRNDIETGELAGKSNQNAALLGVLAYGRKDWKSYDPNGRIQPMKVTSALRADMATAAQKKINKLVATGKATVSIGADAGRIQSLGSEIASRIAANRRR